MDTKVLVGRFVGELPKGQLFVTRELLSFGLRRAVDLCLWNMVQRGLILRLANGVFVRNDIGMKLPPLEEIINAKARGHVKRAIPLGVQLSTEYKLKPKPRRRVKNQKQFGKGAPIVASFAVLGDTSSFNTIYGRVEFRSTPARKYFLSQGKRTRILAAWWASEVGDDFESLIDIHIGSLGKVEKKRFKELGAWSPSWISDLLLDHPPRFATRVPKTIYPFGSIDEEGSYGDMSDVKELVGFYRIAGYIHCRDNANLREACSDSYAELLSDGTKGGAHTEAFKKITPSVS